jgi:hypothetical protein
MSVTFDPRKILVVWHRFGKEHGEATGFRKNPPDVVARSIEEKRLKLGATDPERWEWFSLSDEVFVEFPRSHQHSDEKTTFYYLPKRNWTVMDRHYHPGFDPPWRWYIHIGDFRTDASNDVWIFRDLFADVLVQEDGVTHKLYDLDDLADVLEKGVIDQAECCRILRLTQETIQMIQSGSFPPPELAAAIDYVENGAGAALRPQ